MANATIAMVGHGNVGSALGNTLSRAGHDVYYGLREGADEGAARDSLGPNAKLVPMSEAIEKAEIIFLAVPGPVATRAVEALGSLQGKILVDCTNPAGWDNGPVWNPPEAGSNAAAISALGSRARVVKGFNTFGAEFHRNPALGSGGIDVQLASDDAQAKQRVADVARTAGYNPIDCGPLRNASVLENLAILWIHLAVAGDRGRNFGFVTLDREDS